MSDKEIEQAIMNLVSQFSEAFLQTLFDIFAYNFLTRHPIDTCWVSNESSFSTDGNTLKMSVDGSKSSLNRGTHRPLWICKDRFHVPVHFEFIKIHVYACMYTYMPCVPL